MIITWIKLITVGKAEKWTDSRILNGMISSAIMQHIGSLKSPCYGKSHSKNIISSVTFKNFISDMFFKKDRNIIVLHVKWLRNI